MLAKLDEATEPQCSDQHANMLTPRLNKADVPKTAVPRTAT